jgi:hypothetical protein
MPAPKHKEIFGRAIFSSMRICIFGCSIMVAAFWDVSADSTLCLPVSIIPNYCSNINVNFSNAIIAVTSKEANFSKHYTADGSVGSSSSFLICPNGTGTYTVVCELAAPPEKTEANEQEVVILQIALFFCS